MTKERLLYIAVLLAALASFAGVYQFYFKDKLEEYAEDEKFKDQMQTVYDKLSETFWKTKPEVFATLWAGNVQQWREELRDRAEFFSFGDWYDHEVPPEDVGLLRFWYDEVSQKMLNDIYAKASETPGLRVFPPDLRTMLGVAGGNDWSGVNVTEQMVNSELANLSFGISVAELLLRSGVKGIFEINLWPRRTEAGTEKVLKYQTVGVSILVETKDLIDFFDEELKLNLGFDDERYFTVDTVRLSYPYVGQQYEPQIRADFLMSQARFAGRLGGGNTAGVIAGGGAGGGGARAGGGNNAISEDTNAILERMRQRQQANAIENPAEEPGFFATAWKLFKRYVLYMN